ncbi:hypothetical protein ENUP19_0061G0111 [Entamoeba nuttalli]
MLQKFKQHASPLEIELACIFDEELNEPDLLFVKSFDELIALCQKHKQSIKPNIVRSFLINYSSFVSNELVQERSALELLEAINTPLSYGIVSFDKYFPSLQPSGIIEIAGEAGAGKSQICMQIIVLATLCYKIPCYYICDKRFVYQERIDQIEHYFAQLLDFNPVGVNSFLQIHKIQSFDDFEQTLCSLKETNESGLVIIDCFGTILKTSFEENYNERSVGISRTATILNELNVQGFVVITTNEVVDKIELTEPIPFEFLELYSDLKTLQISTGLDINCDGRVMTSSSGIQWAYFVTHRLFVYKTEESLFSAWDTLSETTQQELDEIDDEMRSNIKIRKCVINKSNEKEKGICLEYCILPSHVCGIERRQPN